MKNYSKVFIAFVALGTILCLVGLVLMLTNLGKSFSIANLKPIVSLVSGFLLIIVGAIDIEMSFRLRWMRRLEKKVDELSLKID